MQPNKYTCDCNFLDYTLADEIFIFANISVTIQCNMVTVYIDVSKIKVSLVIKKIAIVSHPSHTGLFSSVCVWTDHIWYALPKSMLCSYKQPPSPLLVTSARWHQFPMSSCTFADLDFVPSILKTINLPSFYGFQHVLSSWPTSLFLVSCLTFFTIMLMCFWHSSLGGDDTLTLL